MRIILVNQYYEPDVAPTARYLGDLARALVGRGHDIRVICSARSYAGARHGVRRESVDGVHVVRLRAFGFGRATHVGRVLDYASFYLAVGIHLLVTRPKPDVVVSMTTPPFLGVLGSVISRVRRCGHVQWIMDVYPDAMTAHGMLRKESLLHRALAGLMRFSLRHSERTLTLSPDMVETLGKYVEDGARDRISCVPLWVPRDFRAASEEDAAALRKRRRWDASTLVLLYSGNMGLAHRFDELLQAACRLAGRENAPPLRLVFAGAGRQLPALEAFTTSHPGAPLELLPYASQGELPVHLASADVLLLSLDPAWRGCLLPSKIQAAFASGRPVLFVGPTDSTPAGWVGGSGGGWVVAPGDVDGLIRVVEACRSPDERRQRASNAVAYARKHFDAEANLATISQVIENASPSQPGTRTPDPES